MLATFLWRNELLYLIRKEYHTNFIIILNSRKSQRCGNLCKHILFKLFHCTEFQTTRDVDEQHHCQLTFLFEYFDVWFVKASRNIPVYITNIITIFIFT